MQVQVDAQIIYKYRHNKQNKTKGKAKAKDGEDDDDWVAHANKSTSEQVNAMFWCMGFLKGELLWYASKTPLTR